jgi:hypothetical protein
VRYGFEWTPGLILLGGVVVFPLVPSLALIVLAVLALVAVTALVVIAGAVLASPYLIARGVRRHLAERGRPTERVAPLASAMSIPRR